MYYGRFYAGGRRVKRKLGPKRQPGETTGLTKTATERALQKLVDQETRLVPSAGRVDLQTAGARYLVHLTEVMKRKPSTIQDYEIMLRRHLVPFFTGRSVDRIDTQLVSDYLVAKQRAGLSSKTVGNQLTFLHGVFRHAMKKGWTYANPVAAVDRPRDAEADADVRFLTLRGGRGPPTVRHRPGVRCRRLPALPGRRHVRTAAGRTRGAAVARRRLGDQRHPGARQLRARRVGHDARAGRYR